jgi:transcriptional antiterminator
MALFGYQRLAYLFDAILREPLPQAELAKLFSVSMRTIRTDIHALNDALRIYGASVQYERKLGYQLIIQDAELYSKLPRQSKQIKDIPRTAKERIHELSLLFLCTQHPIQLETLANLWHVTLGVLQNDIGELRENFLKYQIDFESKPKLGMHIIGNEIAIRNCLTDILSNLIAKEHQFKQKILHNLSLDFLQQLLKTNFQRFDIKINEMHSNYLGLICAISIARITTGHELSTQHHIDLLNHNEFEIDEKVKNAAQEISKSIGLFLGDAMPSAEISNLEIQIAARKIPEVNMHLIKSDANTQIVLDILNYLNDHYKYNLKHDHKLKASLLEHITSMMMRLYYQINTHNPLLQDIKQYYPFAYDVVLNSISRINHPLFSHINEDEIGYLAVHIAVGLERHYNAEYKNPTALLICDSGNATVLMIEEKIKREFPQLMINSISIFDNELENIKEDFVITTIRLPENNYTHHTKPIIKISPFPTHYQIEQIAKLVLVERTSSYILSHFFDKKHFMIINEHITQSELFQNICSQLEAENYVTYEFYNSLCDREAIVSTMLSENIAIPHALGLLAKKTVIVTILAPNGIKWNAHSHFGASLKSNPKDTAQVIFLLVICEKDYEAIMGMYDLFVAFVREKATKRLLASQNFDEFIMVATDSLTRVSN